EHSKAIARHFDLYDNALLQTNVSELRWDDETKRWIISTDRGDTIRARFVAMANGPLSRPKLPGIPGITDFAGHTFHTSRWDYDYTGGSYEAGTKIIDMPGLADKKVAIIGTGATAVQCVPHLGAATEHLYVFQRTPSSIDVRNNRETDLDELGDRQPGWQQRRMDNFNVLVSGGDQERDLVSDGWTDIFRNLTGIAAKTASRELGRRLTSQEKGKLMELSDYRKMNAVRHRVDDIVDDEATADALKPWYRQFCKRPCFHDEYLPTFNRPNVTLVDTEGRGVTRITETAIVVEEADGRGGYTETEYEVDCIIFATGFEVGTSYTRRAGYDITGRNGETISEKWADGMRTLHGLSVHGFPNCFFLGFTQTGVTVNVPHALNEQAKHVRYILDQARDRGAEVVEATAEGEQDWVDEMKSKARLGEKFYAECTPGYYNNEGKPGENPLGLFTSTYGGGPIKFFRILDEWRENDRLEGLDLK
ncbi:MAG: flavin-containing monooxygenase, partial [Acidimicrobiales bacterium]